MKARLFKIWNYISNIGVTPTMSFERRNNIILTNQYAFTWTALLVLYFFMLVFLAPNEIPFILIILLSTLIVLLLNKFKFYLTSRLWLTILPNFLMCFMSASVVDGRDNSNLSPTGYYVISIALLTLPFLIFGANERIYRIIVIAISCVLFLSFDWLNARLLLPNASPYLSSDSFEIANYFTAVAIMILSLYYFTRTKNYYHTQIICLLDEANETSHKLEGQKKVLESQRQDLEIKHHQMTEHRNLMFDQNKSLTDSIYYALRIQKALLPPPKLLDEFFQECFVINKPCEIVSGDFYFITQKDNYLIVAVGDCTGHGVSAALLSVLGIAFLNDVLNRSKTIEPAAVLDEMRYKFMTSLRQTGAISDSSDGMDMAICFIDTNSHQAIFSGGYSQMYVFSEGNLIEFKGDKSPIGFHPSHLSFTNHYYRYKQGDRFYFFTDGYYDQFGGKDKKKMGRKRFKLLFEEIQTMNLVAQKEFLETHFVAWQDDFEQIDDVLILGIVPL